MWDNMDDVIKAARKSPSSRMAVAAAGDEVVLKSVTKAREDNLVEPVLIGDEEKIKSILGNIGKYASDFEIIDAENKEEAAHKAVRMTAEGGADFPMKGMLSTSIILRALLNKEYGLRQDKLLSLITLMDLHDQDHMIFMSDAGMNPNPDLNEKADIIRNAVTIARAVGFECPGVAVLAAVENVTENMPDTHDAAVLSKMQDRGQIKNCSIDGPLALDNALFESAAEHKGLGGQVAGKADIIITPDIEAGNILYKAMIVYARTPAASVVYGASVPLVLTSRADTAQTKYNSIALAKLSTEGLID